MLREDPAQHVYPRMGFSTRDTYRHVVERVAREARMSEADVARAAVSLANAAPPSSGDEPTTHVGYFLVGDGYADAA